MAGEPRAVIERDADGRWSWWIEVLTEHGTRWGPCEFYTFGPGRWLHWGTRRTARWSARRRLRQYARWKRRRDEPTGIIAPSPPTPPSKETE